MPRTPNVGENRREQIIDAALRVFAEKGFTRATNRDVAREAGITTGLISSFEKKEALLLAVLEARSPVQMVAQIPAQMLEQPPEVFLPMIVGRMLSIVETEQFLGNHPRGGTRSAPSSSKRCAGQRLASTCPWACQKLSEQTESQGTSSCRSRFGHGNPRAGRQCGDAGDSPRHAARARGAEIYARRVGQEHRQHGPAGLSDTLRFTGALPAPLEAPNSSERKTQQRKIIAPSSRIVLERFLTFLS